MRKNEVIYCEYSSSFKISCVPEKPITLQTRKKTQNSTIKVGQNPLTVHAKFANSEEVLSFIPGSNPSKPKYRKVLTLGPNLVKTPITLHAIHDDLSILQGRKNEFDIIIWGKREHLRFVLHDNFKEMDDFKFEEGKEQEGKDVPFELYLRKSRSHKKFICPIMVPNGSDCILKLEISRGWIF